MVLKSMIIAIFTENGKKSRAFLGGFGRLPYPMRPGWVRQQPSAAGTISAGTLIVKENLILQMR